MISQVIHVFKFKFAIDIPHFFKLFHVQIKHDALNSQTCGYNLPFLHKVVHISRAYEQMEPEVGHKYKSANCIAKILPNNWLNFRSLNRI